MTTRDQLAEKVYEQLNKTTSGLSAFEKQLALNSALNLLNSIETRQQQLQAQHAQDLQTLVQIKYIESPTIVTRATATQSTAASKRAGYAVAIILGLIVGVLLALLSYTAWPARKRETPAE
jgi:hypothetical protein